MLGSWYKKLTKQKSISLVGSYSYVLSHVQLTVTPWTVAHQAPLSVGILQARILGGLPFPPPGDLPDPGMEPTSLMFPALQVDSLPLSYQGSPLLTRSDSQFSQFVYLWFCVSFVLQVDEPNFIG